MKNAELYNRTVDILVKAFLQGELDEMDSARCVVGNIVAANCRYKWIKFDLWKDKEGKPIEPDWNRCMETFQTLSTGYTNGQLGLIEEAFMHDIENTFPSKDDRDFSGLMAVIDVLDEIHEVKDENITSTSKVKFEKV